MNQTDAMVTDVRPQAGSHLEGLSTGQRLHGQLKDRDTGLTEVGSPVALRIHAANVGREPAPVEGASQFRQLTFRPAFG
jgi:hypothetical protein